MGKFCFIYVLGLLTVEKIVQSLLHQEQSKEGESPKHIYLNIQFLKDNFVIIFFYIGFRSTFKLKVFTHFRDEKVAGKALACVDDIAHLK